MVRKKSAVDRLKNAEIRVSLDKGKTYDFVIGEVLKPDWDVVRTVFRKAYELGYAEELLGSPDEAVTLVSGNKEQLEYYVPLVCRLIDQALMQGKYEAQLHPGLIAIAYVLAWYWHFNLGGPRPLYDPKRYRTKVVLKVEWRCPVCNKEFEPPSRLVHIQPKYNAFIRWLDKHHRSYHKEWIYGSPK